MLFDPMREAFRVDRRGIGLEFKLQTNKWRFELDKINYASNRVNLWHKLLDVNVLVDQARKAAGKMTRAELRIFKN